MKIKIYAVGRLKDKYLKQGVNEYLKRLKPYVQIEIMEVEDESVKDNPSEKDLEMVKNKEGQKIIKSLKSNEYLIGLDLVKKQPTSLEFASYLQDKLVLGGANISFVIGGSYGLSDEIKQRCNDRIALSNMTFPHQLSRLILLEQIYRAFKINRNEVYHK
ncbi:MAG TPA: 23S rRNA (pseudouridine(1915)-N(3))-methyltransferase RlmH [Erysipelotrichaceae bacterium]|nr:23S rRNA (pseudouridine(1915)-N(3))-methyltransferase RlmH [Erysipelotrichaceae bacterium]